MENRITVVLADANEEFRTALQQTLENAEGFDVVGSAADGLAAAQLVQEKRPQLLVMDLLLPGLDGFGVLKRLRTLIKLNTLPDMFLANYVYEKEGSKHKKVMRQKGFPKEKMFGWDDVGHLAKGHYILMHSVIYRTQMLHECGLQLPEHTFYVDNIYVYKPLPYVNNMYYMDVDLYRYYIGREDQSVNEQTMIRRIDQQIRVNKIMFADVNLLAVKDKKCRRCMFNYLEIVTTITLAILSGTKENLNKRDELWAYMKQTDRQLYNKLHHSVISRYMNLPGRTGRFLGKVAYRISRKVYGFN